MSHDRRGSGCSSPASKSLTRLREHLLQEFWSDVVEEIERPIPNARMPRRHFLWVPDVCLTQLDEPPTARQEPQRRVDEFFLQAIEYDVHAGAAGCEGKLLLEFERA